MAESYYENQEFRRARRLFEQIKPKYRGKPQGERITFFYANCLLNTKNYLLSAYEFESFTTKWYVNKDYSSALKQIYIIFDKGYSVMDILDCYFTFIKMTDMLDEMLKYKIIKLICKYITIFNTVHESEIELTLFTYDLINTVESI